MNFTKLSPRDNTPILDSIINKNESIVIAITPEIKNLNPFEMTPMEALNKLCEFKEKIK